MDCAVTDREILMIDRVLQLPVFDRMFCDAFSEGRSIYKEFLQSAFLGSMLIAISAQLSVHFGIVPFTLQTSAIFLVVYELGVNRGTAAVLMYLLEGAAGLPVFQHFSSGIMAFAGPTGGYLLGFVPMAYTFGSLLEVFGTSEAFKTRNVSFLLLIFAEITATIVDYVFGCAQLLMFVPLKAVYAVGVQPFLFTGIAKVTLAAVIMKSSLCSQRSK